MKSSFKILLVEDREEDAVIIRYELAKDKVEADMVRVDNRDDFLAQLDHTFDVIIADYTLPEFNAKDVLSLRQDLHSDIPVIVISGILDEHTVVDCILKGANDYLLKDRLTRLNHAIHTAIENRNHKQEKRKAEMALKASERQFRTFVETTAAAIFIVREGKIYSFNPAALTLTDYAPRQLMSMPYRQLIHPDFRETIDLEHNDSQARFTFKILTAAKQEKWVDVTVDTTDYEGQPAVLITALDITESQRTKAELQALNAILDSLLQTNNLHQIAAHIRSVISQILPSVTSRIAIFDELSCKLVWLEGAETNWITLLDSSHDLEHYPYVLMVFEQQEPLWLSAPNDDHDIIIMMPLLYHSKTIGILELQHSRDNPLEDYNLVLLKKLVDQAAQALETVRIINQNELLMDQLLHFNRVITTVSNSLNIKETLEIICHEIGQTTFDYVFVTWQDKDRDYFKGYAEYPVSAPYPVIGLELPDPDQTIRRYFENLYLEQFIDPLYLEPNHPLLGSLCSLLQKNRLNTVAVIPLAINNQVHGFLGICKHEMARFSYHEIELVQAVIIAASHALKNSTVHAVIEANNTLLERQEQKQRSRLERLNDQLNLILDNTSDALLLLYADGFIRRANQAFCDLFYYEVSDIPSLNLTMLCPSSEVQYLQDMFNETILSGKPQHFTITGRRKDNTLFDADIALAPILVSESRDHHKAVCSIRDITAQKQVERLKDVFVQTISHELRTPVQTLLASATTLKTHLPKLSATNIQDIANRLYNQSQVLFSLVQSVLAIMTLDNPIDTHDHQWQSVDMEILMTDLLDDLAEDIKIRQHTVMVKHPQNPFHIYGVYSELKRIWHNLIDNAIKYTDNMGVITIRWGRLSEMASLLESPIPIPNHLTPEAIFVGQVEDNGQGIDGTDLELIFRGFYRGHATATNISGNGLGLFFVKGILQRYHGNILVNSQLNQGTTFTFWLPIEGGLYHG